MGIANTGIANVGIVGMGIVNMGIAPIASLIFFLPLIAHPNMRHY